VLITLDRFLLAFLFKHQVANRGVSKNGLDTLDCCFLRVVDLRRQLIELKTLAFRHAHSKQVRETDVELQQKSAAICIAKDVLLELFVKQRSEVRGGRSLASSLSRRHPRVVANQRKPPGP